jgi:hypothetical protein
MLSSPSTFVGRVATNGLDGSTNASFHPNG